MLIFVGVAEATLLTDGYVGDEGGGGECAGGAARQLGEVAVGHEVLEGGGDADVVDTQEPAPGEALYTAARSRIRIRTLDMLRRMRTQRSRGLVCF